MKLVVAGSRGYKNKTHVFALLDKLLESIPDLEIVSGLANGPDSFGKEWAESRGITCHEFPAHWDTYGKKAGYMRNEQMAEFSDSLLAFWDGKSRGTMHMINLARKYGLKVAIVEF